MSVQQQHGGELTAEEFRKFTLYCHLSNNQKDDSQRAQILGFTQKDVRVAPGAIVRIGANQIGRNSYVGLYSYVNGDVELGENILIGPHVSIVASNHVYDPVDDCFSARSDKVAGKVVIEDGVWLTSGVVVTPGSRIGRCALVCANSVVSGDIPPYSIAAGTPAKIVGKIDRSSGEYHWFSRKKDAT